jgi:hypothetical protein
VLSEDYKIFIDGSSPVIEQKDLYCFEASLYKHWTEEFNSRRVFLSFGFIVPYSVVGRTEPIALTGNVTNFNLGICPSC